MDRVMVVDDEQVMRAFLEKALSRLGYEVTLVETAEQAVATFAPRSYSLVLSDLRMPGQSGFDLLDHIRGLDPETPVVIMTAYGSISNAVEAVKRGATDFITKPLELSQLKLVLERVTEKQKATKELEKLRPLADEREGLAGMVGRSLAMKRVYSLIDKVADRDLTVLILGETGTGKEVCARAIHEQSPRARERFQVVNCAGLQETLLESELFGHEKGSFTGADKRRLGHFEVAVGGTLFLDEVGEAPLSVQTKLLRAIQEKEIVRVGGTDAISVDVRILAATNRDLEAEVSAGRFREDLYYRLSPFPIRLAPLRERSDDFPLLVEHFLKPEGLSEAALTARASLALRQHPWPGNIRQLANVLSRAAVLAGEEQIDLEHLPAEFSQQLPEKADPVGVLGGALLDLPLRQARAEFERFYLEELLRQCQGNVSQAARRAELGRASLHEKINKLGLDPSRFRPER